MQYKLLEMVSPYYERALFVVGQFIARLLPIYFLKLHETSPTGGVEKVYLFLGSTINFVSTQR